MSHYEVLTVPVVVNLVIGIGLSVRVIMRRRPVGVSLAWISIVMALPFAGIIAYLMIGELRLGNRRADWAKRLHDPYERWLADLNQRCPVDWSKLGPECEPVARLSEKSVGIPALPGNELHLISDWKKALESIISDIDAAHRTCHMEFYIWSQGGLVDEVVEALIRASNRGVICRILVDDVGSQAFVQSAVAQRMRAGGIQLRSALPAGIIRNLFVRFDLRMHRKIVVIDGRIGYTGSLNMVDPRYFKQEAGVGQWIDAMARVRGPAVEALAITFLEDWSLETGESVDKLQETGDVHPLRPRWDAVTQVIPSGPVSNEGAIQRILLMAIFAARKELVLTTPYFVPDESLLDALITAAQRGVNVILVVPSRVDSFLVRTASQAFQGDLVEAGVQVMLFGKGLLHTKSVTVDGDFSLFGSLNLDPRSFHLNFEITLSVYDKGFTSRLRSLQEDYIQDSQPMDIGQWQSRPRLQMLKENTARLLGPLL